MRFRRCALCVSATAILVAATIARAAAIGPTVMMFYGPPLAAPIVVTGPDASLFGNLHDRSNVSLRDLEGRSFIAVALFWGPASDPAFRDIADPRQLKPEMAWQQGRYYPPSNGRPGVLITTAFTKGAQKPQDAATAFVNGGAISSQAQAVLTRAGL